MTYLRVRLKAVDFERWKRVFGTPEVAFFTDQRQ